MRSAQTERTDAAGSEDSTVSLTGHLQDIPQSINTDLPCQMGLALGHHGEQGGQIVDGVDIITAHDVGDLLPMLINPGSTGDDGLLGALLGKLQNMKK